MDRRYDGPRREGKGKREKRGRKATQKNASLERENPLKKNQIKSKHIRLQTCHNSRGGPLEKERAKPWNMRGVIVLAQPEDLVWHRPIRVNARVGRCGALPGFH